jgi:membrane protease YdiL (CAAX protease family)
VEELAFRLFALAGIAWLLARFVRNRERVFPPALIVSAFLFGALHILEPAPVTGTPAAVHMVGVLVKSSAAGLLLGWIFLRWGLLYSMACHSAANATHIVLAPSLF